jgi:hypothetical protein
MRTSECQLRSVHTRVAVAPTQSWVQSHEHLLHPVGRVASPARGQEGATATLGAFESAPLWLSLRFWRSNSRGGSGDIQHQEMAGVSKVSGDR